MGTPKVWPNSAFPSSKLDAANPDFTDLDAVDYSKYKHVVASRPDPNLPGLLQVELQGPGTQAAAAMGVRVSESVALLRLRF